MWSLCHWIHTVPGWIVLQLHLPIKLRQLCLKHQLHNLCGWFLSYSKLELRQVHDWRMSHLLKQRSQLHNLPEGILLDWNRLRPMPTILPRLYQQHFLQFSFRTESSYYNRGRTACFSHMLNYLPEMLRHWYWSLLCMPWRILPSSRKMRKMQRKLQNLRYRKHFKMFVMLYKQLFVFSKPLCGLQSKLQNLSQCRQSKQLHKLLGRIFIEFFCILRQGMPQELFHLYQPHLMHSVHLRIHNLQGQHFNPLRSLRN